MDSPRSYDLFIGPDQYVLYNASSTAKERPLVIDRVTTTLSISSNFPLTSSYSEYDVYHYEGVMPRPTRIYGILGTMRLLSGRFLMTIDRCELVGNLFGHQIFQVTSASLHPFAKSMSHLSAVEMEAETAFVNMLTFMLQMKGMYFSNTYDLTVSQQRLSEFGPECRNMSLFERADKQFLWNNIQLQDWSQVLEAAAESSGLPFNISNYLTPVILGFVGILKASNSPESIGRVASYAVISRRAVNRAGTRYFARGLDSSACSANFVETEQLVYLPPNHIYSFVQIRGSVPLYWSQRPTLEYKPGIKLGRSEPASSLPNSQYEPQSLADVEPIQRDIIQRHFRDVCYFLHYGKVIAVNLLDQTGMERPLCRMYTLASLAVDSEELKYEAFDFHRECRGLKWDRVHTFIDRLEPELAAMGQLRLSAPSSRESLQDAVVLTQQCGVFRTNCIDCLDRTNVLQSVLAQRALIAALREADIPTTTTSAREVELWPGFGMAFRTLWADHADMLSLQYSGTPALKTDFTRTGKRTFKGMLMDGYNSLVRYYLNNFADGFRQDAFNLFLGHYEIFNPVTGRAKLPLPQRERQSIRRRFLPFFLAFSISMSVLCLLFPSVDLTHRLTYFAFWGLASAFSMSTILSKGQEFVNNPRFPME
ncbi:Phosphatidylinositide phosphatase SAC1 [Echinococcus granulosus]|uniref:Phosphatidylinositol-3-phosphatase SAC1 n=1 Tax=Echinococcus granulosus TaxID=6210 RepID=W6UKU6_ECHGR|nr:Phosphatidylinositide phosphatase SAC1 [Echinococcus granulosus]EUB61703.1 Phosphatidylinositide phosphatase SAC1 [Echinococcus granulosus]